jgi:hypothetical protein
MRDHLTRLFWGLLIVGVDVRVYGAVDLLPDGIGYLLIASGCGGLAGQSTSFARARTLCLVLATLWLLGLSPLGAPLGVLLATLTWTLDVVSLWHLLAGVADIARTHGRLDLAAQARARRAYVVAFTIGVGLLVLLMQLTRAFEPFLLLVAIGSLLVMCGVLQVIQRVRLAVTP